MIFAIIALGQGKPRPYLVGDRNYYHEGHEENPLGKIAAGVMSLITQNGNFQNCTESC